MEELSEVIYCKCGKLFAACADGHQDKEWEKNRTQYLRDGCRFELVSDEIVRRDFACCGCKTEEVEVQSNNQLSLF